MTSHRIRQFLGPLVPLSHGVTKFPCSLVTSRFPYSQFWMTRKGQSDEKRLKCFELQTIRKQPSSGVNK